MLSYSPGPQAVQTAVSSRSYLMAGRTKELEPADFEA